MGALIVASMAVGAVAGMAHEHSASYNQKRLQLSIELDRLELMTPETRKAFLEHKAQMQREQLAIEKEKNEAYLRHLAELDRKRKEYFAEKILKEKIEQYERESRANYPHAWMLSDWVDDMAKILDEGADFHPIPRLMNNEN